MAHEIRTVPDLIRAATGFAREKDLQSLEDLIRVIHGWVIDEEQSSALTEMVTAFIELVEASQ